jgi:hypothetical protein
LNTDAEAYECRVTTYPSQENSHLSTITKEDVSTKKEVKKEDI